MPNSTLSQRLHSLRDWKKGDAKGRKIRKVRAVGGALYVYREYSIYRVHILKDRERVEQTEERLARREKEREASYRSRVYIFS